MNGCKVGRVEVSCPFLLFAAWMLYRDDSGIVIQGLLACLIHELGHCVALWQLGNRAKFVRITLFGAKIIPENTMNYREEFFAAIMGPVANLLLAFLFGKTDAGLTFAAVNLALGVFNLLPVCELDGARVLRCTLACMMSDDAACIISEYVSFAFTVLFSALGICAAIYHHNITLLLMSFWILKRLINKKTL